MEKQGSEFCYEDRNGKKRDALLHAELLGEDTSPWDVTAEDLERIADMTDEELDRFLTAKQGA